jgi:hypothetical protein
MPVDSTRTLYGCASSVSGVNQNALMVVAIIVMALTLVALAAFAVVTAA